MHIFLGLGGMFYGWGSSRKIFHRVGSFQGVNFSGEILHRRNLSELLYEILLMSCFLFSVSILRVEILRVIVRGIFSRIELLKEQILGEEEFFHGGVTRFPGTI